MGINVKKIIDMADMFKRFESKLNMGTNVPQTKGNANRLSGLISVDEIEPLVPLPKGGVDVTINGRDTPPVWFGNIQEAFNAAQYPKQVSNVRNSLLHGNTKYDKYGSWIQGDNYHILHQRLDDGLLGHITPGSKQVQMFKDNVDWTKTRRANEYTIQNPLTRPKDWPVDINEAGAYNLDYKGYKQPIQVNRDLEAKRIKAERLADLERRKAAIIEQGNKNTLEQMRLDALNRNKR